MKILLVSSALLITAVLLLKGLVLFLEPRLAFFPATRITATPQDLGIPFEEIFIPTRDGEQICAWFLPHAEAKAEILFFHGNAGNLSQGRIDLIAGFHNQGYSLFAFDYRGFGRSSGSPSEQGIYADSEAFVDYFWKRLHDPEKAVIYFGNSIGTITASFAAQHKGPDGLVLQAGFPDLKSLLQYLPLTMRLLGTLSSYELSAVKFLSKVKCPTLVIHGDRDSIIPYDLGRRLFESLDLSEKEFYLVRGGDHADQADVGGRAYWMKLESFALGLKEGNSGNGQDSHQRN